MHDFTINNQNTSRWSLSFEDGTYQELIKAPTRKQSPLEMNWGDHSGVETDRSFNHYESKPVSLPVFIEGKTQDDLLQNYNRFVNEVIMPGADIYIGSQFLKRRFRMRYTSISSAVWSDLCVNFNLQLTDDFPSTILAL